MRVECVLHKLDDGSQGLLVYSHREPCITVSVVLL